MSDAGVEGSEAFGRPPGGGNAPDIELVRKGSLHKVDETVVGRPNREVTMDSGRGHENGWGGGSLQAVGDEEGLAGARRVVSKPRGIVRPVELGDAVEVGPRGSTQGGHGLDTDVAAARGRRPLLANPARDQRASGREAQCTDGWIDEFGCAAAREIVELTGTDLRDPDIHLAVAVG